MNIEASHTRVTITSCWRLLKTGLNNVVLPTLFNVVNNTGQDVEPESSPQSGVSMPNNIADNIEQYGRHQQLVIFAVYSLRFLYMQLFHRYYDVSTWLKAMYYKIFQALLNKNLRICNCKKLYLVRLTQSVINHCYP